MSNERLLIEDEDYEPVAMEFLRVLGVELDLVLRKCGITEPKLRDAVVDTFCFGMGNFFDQYWFESDGNRYWPVLAFSQQHIDAESFVEARYPPVFSYHEYAFGTFEQICPDGVTYVDDLRIGLINADEPNDLNRHQF